MNEQRILFWHDKMIAPGHAKRRTHIVVCTEDGTHSDTHLAMSDMLLIHLTNTNQMYNRTRWCTSHLIPGGSCSGCVRVCICGCIDIVLIASMFDRIPCIMDIVVCGWSVAFASVCCSLFPLHSLLMCLTLYLSGRVSVMSACLWADRVLLNDEVVGSTTRTPPLASQTASQQTTS